MTIRSALTQTNSYIHILTCMLIDERPDIDSDLMNSLLVYWTEFFLVREKSGINVSVHLLAQTPHSSVSAQVSCSLSTVRRSITPRSSPNRPDGRLDGTGRALLRRDPSAAPIPLDEKHRPSSRFTTSTSTIVRRPAHTFSSSSCTTMAFLRTVTPPSPSCARCTITPTANLTTSTRSGCPSGQHACCLNSEPPRQDSHTVAAQQDDHR